MPKLWNTTIEAHRREVREAILETTARLVAEHGLRSVTMSQIAEESGIGRATLYKYFRDVDAILVAWHDRQVSDHLGQLTALGVQSDNAGKRLEAVLEAYALMLRARPHGTDVAVLVHRGEHLAEAHQHLSGLIQHLLANAAATGDIRDDVATDELAQYCLHALAAAATLPSEDAVRRLVQVTLAGLRPPLS